MKLSEYVKKHGITYRTAFRWWQHGQIKGFQKPSGTIIVTEGEQDVPGAKKVVLPVVIYARVSFLSPTKREFGAASGEARRLLCGQRLSSGTGCEGNWFRSQR